MYGSLNNPDPSPVWHYYMLSSIHGDIETVWLLKVMENSGSTVPFYCNLVAIDNSVFQSRL